MLQEGGERLEVIGGDDNTHVQTLQQRPSQVSGQTRISYRIIILFVLRLNVPVNNFSVMSGWSQLFLGLTSTVRS